MRKNLLTVSLAVCCGMILSTAVGLAADNWIGIWKLDVAKSKYSPGPAPRGQMLKFVHERRNPAHRGRHHGDGNGPPQHLCLPL